MTKQQYMDEKWVHLDMTDEFKQHCFEVARNLESLWKKYTINDPNRFYYCYELTCKETGFSYYAILDGITGILSPEDSAELKLEVKDKQQLRELKQIKLENATIRNPNQYVKLCYPLYEDMVIYGLDSFEVSIAYENHYTGALWSWGRLILGIWGGGHICFNPFTVPYNLIEDWKFKGIKCIETQEIFDTPGQAAKAVGLKSKTSILKALNDYNKTAANYHWACLDKP